MAVDTSREAAEPLVLVLQSMANSSDLSWGSDHVEEAAEIILALLSRAEKAEAEAFALAANQCHDGYSTEHGHHRCKYQDRLEKAEAELDTQATDAFDARQEILDDLRTERDQARAELASLKKEAMEATGPFANTTPKQNGHGHWLLVAADGRRISFSDFDAARAFTEKWGK